MRLFINNKGLISPALESSIYERKYANYIMSWQVVDGI
jgi:hypothetical protein